MFEQFISDYNEIYKEMRKSIRDEWKEVDQKYKIVLTAILLSMLAVIVVPFVLPKGITMIVIWVLSVVFTLTLFLVLNHFTKVQNIIDRKNEERYKKEKEILEKVYKKHYNAKAFKPFLMWVKESCLSKLLDLDKTIDRIEKTFSVSWVFAIIIKLLGFVEDKIRYYIDLGKESLAELLEALLKDPEIGYAIAIALVIFLLFVVPILLFVRYIIKDYYVSKKYIHRRLIKTIDYMLIEEGNQCHCFE